MKRSLKHPARVKDDSLFGLLSSYKASHTYVRVLESEANDSIVVQITDNPSKFTASDNDTSRDYRALRRLEIGIAKISLKYLEPEYLVSVLGPLLEINIPHDKAVIINGLDRDSIYSIEISRKYKTKVIQGVKKLLGMSPQKKYELLEKYLSGHQE